MTLVAGEFRPAKRPLAEIFRSATGSKLEATVELTCNAYCSFNLQLTAAIARKEVFKAISADTLVRERTIPLQKSFIVYKMKFLELSALFSLSTLVLSIKAFRMTNPCTVITRSAADSSLYASRNQPDLSRAASFIVGSTLPFLFSFSQDEKINPNQLNLHVGQQHATADSTGKVYRMWHSEITL